MGTSVVYDREEVKRRLCDAGFTDVNNVEWGRSDLPELRNRETRLDSLLICEAKKRILLPQS